MPKQRPKGEGVHFDARQATGEGADAARGGHEGGRFPGDGGEVMVFGALGAEGGPDLGHLTLTELTQGVGEEAGDLGAERGGDLGRPGQKEVPGHDGHEIAPAGVDALDRPPHGGLVHDVVVVERGQVDELHGHRSLQVVGLGLPAPAGGRRQGQAGTQAFAAGGDQVAGDLVQKGVARAHRPAELGFEAGQVAVHERERQERGGVHRAER
jgi:hypothetical protein